MTHRLPGLLAELGRRLPQSHLTEWVRVLQNVGGPADTRLDRLVANTRATRPAHQLAELRQVWQTEEPGLSGAAIALALATAEAAPYEGDRSGRLVELVVSGPASPSLPLRLTSGIAIDVIQMARESLIVSSFAAYGVTDVVAEIGRAVVRGVGVDLLLEESTEAAKAFASLHGRVRLWHRADVHHSSSLHAKVIVADRHTALLGSANLTDRALNDNVEVGVIVRDPSTVGRLVDHLRWLTGPESHFLRST